jgi:hypothetical protein
LGQCGGQRERALGRGLEQVKGEALCAARADPGQPRQLGDEPFE